MSRFRDAWVRVAAAAAVLLPFYFLLAALATKYGLLDWRTGFAVLSLQIGPLLAVSILALGLVGLALAGLARPRRGWRLALFSILTPGAVLVIVAGPVLAARRAPPLRDISTDVIDPPLYSHTVAAERALMADSNTVHLGRARTPNDPAYGAAAGRLEIDVQRAAYPDIQPIAVGAPRARAFAAALGAAQALGWSIDRVDQTGGTIEARVVNFWYGFVDDIVIRVTASDPGAVVDVRSGSRTGPIDLGANAARVRGFTKEIGRQLAQE